MSTFIDYFDHEYLPKLAGRAPTFRAVMREALAQSVQSIVETGCIRKDNNWEGDGQSSKIFAAYVRWSKGSFVSVDISQEAVDLANSVDKGIAAVCEDSVIFLNKYSTRIDLLYLDSYDVNLEDPHLAALHCMFEFAAARPKLHPGSIVFVDDSPMGPSWDVGGKALYLAKYMEQLGIRPFTFGYQVAWIMP